MTKNAPNKEELYKMALEAVKNHQKQPARMMLHQVLQIDNRDARAMMLMAKVASSPEERADWLKRVLSVDPKNKAAKKALRKIESHDEAERNHMLLRVGSAIYVVVVLIVSVIMMVVFT